MRISFTKVVDLIFSTYKDFGITNYRCVLSLRKAGTGLTCGWRCVNLTGTCHLTEPAASDCLTCYSYLYGFKLKHKEKSKRNCILQHPLMLAMHDPRMQYLLKMEKLKGTGGTIGSLWDFHGKIGGAPWVYMAMAGWKTEDLRGIDGIMSLAASTIMATASDIVTDALTAFAVKTSIQHFRKAARTRTRTSA